MKDLRTIYQATILPMFTYGSSVWYSDRKQGTNTITKPKAVTMLRRVQQHAAQIISGAFQTTAGDVLDAECHLLPPETNLKALGDSAILRMGTTPKLAEILTLNQSAENSRLSHLHLLLNRFTTLYGRDIRELEVRQPYTVPPWWQPPKTVISMNADEAIANHNATVLSTDTVIVYTDGSGIAERIGAAATALYTGEERSACLGSSSEYTVYSGELVGLHLALDIVEGQNTIKKAIIYTDNQAAIKTLANPQSKSAQYIIQQIVKQYNRLICPVEIH